jgi:hypothetical protein
MPVENVWMTVEHLGEPGGAGPGRTENRENMISRYRIEMHRQFQPTSPEKYRR